jgi:hypothetical protein
MELRQINISKNPHKLALFTGPQKILAASREKI